MKQKKGITLIALIITIIVLLILAGVSISFMFGNEGIIEKTQQATNEYDKTAGIEKMIIKVSEVKMKYYLEQQRDVTLQELADYLTADEYVEYVKLGDKIASIDVKGYSSIVVKLKEYVYEFEVTDKFEVSIYEREKNVVLYVGGLLQYASELNKSGLTTTTITGKLKDKREDTVTYSMNTIYIDGDVVLDGIQSVAGVSPVLIKGKYTYEFGNAQQDVGTENGEAHNMVILKINGDLTISENVVLTACKSANGYGGPKGMMLFCTGTITNNGTISMTGRGAKATGENVFLMKNDDESYEYIPAVGASGVAASTTTSLYNDGHNALNGNSGNAGTGRQTGGGGSGSVRNYIARMYPGSGGAGTSYSGGCGGGAAATDRASTRYAGNGSSTGGAGGHGAQGGNTAGNSGGSTNGWGQAAGGGQGNRPGNCVWSHADASVPAQDTGTGGLLIIYCNTLNNLSNISANGVAAPYITVSRWNGSQGGGHILSGGSSGGGSVNIFAKFIEERGNITATGGASQSTGMSWTGGKGGNGTVTVNTI